MGRNETKVLHLVRPKLARWAATLSPKLAAWGEANVLFLQLTQQVGQKSLLRSSVGRAHVGRIGSTDLLMWGIVGEGWAAIVAPWL